MNNKKHVLCLVDYVARTGFGTVGKNIIHHLRKHYKESLQLDIIAINYFGEPFYEDDNTCIISARKEDAKDDPYGRYFFLKMLKEGNYDGVFICQDIGSIQPLVEVMEFIKKEKKENNLKQFKSIFYFPIDCDIIEQLVKGIEFFDVLVTYTEFARQQVLKFRPELKTKIHVVPHGNNSKDFYPLPAEEAAAFREEFFGENANKFIITNVNRNQPRKDIPNTIFGFIEAKNIWEDTLYDLPKPFLYLHMHPKDPLGWDIRAIMLQTDLKEGIDYKLLPAEYEESGCPTEVVNKIYNASDVFITTSVGEGWGLSCTEAAACKVPVVAPLHTSFAEMFGDHKAYMLKNLYPTCHNIDNVVRHQTDIIEIGETLFQVAIDKHEKNTALYTKTNNAYNWVANLEWEIVCRRWIEYFKIL